MLATQHDLTQPELIEFQDWLIQFKEFSLSETPEVQTNFNLSVTHIHLLTTNFFEKIRVHPDLIIAIPRLSNVESLKFLTIVLSLKRICIVKKQTNPALSIKEMRIIQNLCFVVPYFCNWIKNTDPTNIEELEQLTEQLLLYKRFIFHQLTKIQFFEGLITNNCGSMDLRKIINAWFRKPEIILETYDALNTSLFGKIHTQHDVDSHMKILGCIYTLLDTYTKKKPDDSGAWYLLSRNKLICNNSPKDWSILHKVFTSPENAQFYPLLLWLAWYYQRKNHLPAIFSNTPALQQVSPFGKHLEWIVYLLLDKPDMAWPCYQKAIQEYPDYFKHNGLDQLNRHMVLETVSYKLGREDVAVQVRRLYQSYKPEMLKLTYPKKKVGSNRSILPKFDIDRLINNCVSAP